MSKINLVIASKHYENFVSQFKAHPNLDKHFNLLAVGTNFKPNILKQTQVLLGEPDILADIVHDCRQLVWVQSTWAGNNKLQGISKRDYQLTGVKGVFGSQMAEYVLSYLLYFSRRIEEFNVLKKQRRWSPLPCYSLANKTIGIMGLGSIGQDLAKHLQAFNVPIKALTRSIKPLDNIEQFLFDDLPAFLAECDVVISVLPETDHTIGLCDHHFFSLMRPKSIFMNVGRGSLIDDPQALINALKTGHLSAAVLDVFDKEPLPNDHPYYLVDKLYISCHTASISKPLEVFEVFAENANRFINNEALLYLHDFNKGY